MNDINNITIIGRLTRDPELRHTQNGTSVTSFSIAVNSKYNDKEQTSFFNCVAWSKTGEIVAQYSGKGQRIGISGRLQQRTWEDKQGNKQSTVEIIAGSVQLLTPNEK